MAKIENNDLYYITEEDLDEDDSYQVPNNIRKIYGLHKNYQKSLSIRTLYIGSNILDISDDAFDYTYIQCLFLDISYYKNNNYINVIEGAVLSNRIKNVLFVNSNLNDIAYHDFKFDKDIIYQGKIIKSKQELNGSVKNGDYVIGIKQKYVKPINFKGKYRPCVNCDITDTLYFKIKKDKDGYLFAIDYITDEIIPIIYCKEEIIQKSSAISEMSAGIAFNTIKMASHEDLEYLEKLKNSFWNRGKKTDYILTVNNSLKRVNYVYPPILDYEEKRVIIDKKRKSDFIEDIRNYLLKLSDINMDSYHKYNQKFNDILTSNPDDIETKLINLNAEIQVELTFGIINFSNNSNLTDNINNLTSIYYDRLVKNDGNTDDKTYKPENIDTIAAFVIKNIDKMSYLEVDNISRNIAFMYFAEIKLCLENNTHIDIDNNPYLEYFKKHMYYLIKLLIINGYLATDIAINIEETDLLKLIKNIDISMLNQDIKKKVLNMN